MKGTEKQIEWATEIKNNIINTYTAALPMFSEAERPMLLAVIDKVNAVESAGDFIDAYKDASFNGDLNHDWTQLCVVNQSLDARQRELFAI